MRDKNGWNLTKKQRETYLDNVKMLYGPPSQGSVGFVPPRVSMEDLGLTHEEPPVLVMPPNAVDLVFGFVSSHPPLDSPKQERLGREGVEPDPCQGSDVEVPRGTRKPAKSKARKEWREQADVVKWCKKHPLIAEDVIRIENERKRNMAQAYVARMMGLHSGATDLFISYPSSGYHGLWLEMKQDRNYTASDRRKSSWVAQEKFMDRKRKQGYAAAFAFGAEQGIEIISRYLDGNLNKPD